MRPFRSLIIDTWGALSYKPAFQWAAEGRAAGLPGQAGASWVPDVDRRRLAAYTLLVAYGTNQAAALLDGQGEDRREYGDPALVVDQTLTHLLGETQQIVVAGSENEDAASRAAESLLREWAEREHLWMRMQHTRSATPSSSATPCTCWPGHRRRRGRY